MRTMLRLGIIFCVLVGFAALIPIATPFIIKVSVEDSIFERVEDVPAQPVAIVFGAGLRRDGAPSDVLRDRLIIVARLYEEGKVKKILVSGDNRVESYNEPQAMRDTLIADFGIPEGDIAIDFAGRRTYDTCARAHEIWGVDSAILVTQAFHLPRAVWTCQRLGIDANGVSATLRSYVRDEYYVVREFIALNKAAFDVFIWHPAYMGGAVEENLDETL